MFKEYNKQEEKEQRALLIGSVTKRIKESKDKRLNCGCDSGGSYMYYDEDGDYIKIEDVIKLINTIE
jgi:hypothetical protein